VSDTIDKQLNDYKVELETEWLMLQTHKWRRPKWVKFPRSMLEDVRWIKLSDRAKAAWPSILLIASEHPSSRLPDPELLYRRLRLLGHCPRLDSFSSLIEELNQCGFLVKTTPELQRYRVTEIQNKKEGNGPVDNCGKLQPNGWANGCPIKDGSEDPQLIAQPKLPWSIPVLAEITGTVEASLIKLQYAAAPDSFRAATEAIG